MPKRPNILIFMTDQQQGQTVAAGHPCLTPNVDRLASQGIRFNQTYCPTAHCCPSRATFMTGLYPSRHGIYNNVQTPTAIHYGLNDGVLTFSEQLRQAGYDLAYSGKWHVSALEDPSDRGWDSLHVTAGKSKDLQGTMQPKLDRWRQPLPDWARGEQRRRGWIQRPGWGNRPVYDLADDGPLSRPISEDQQTVDAALEALPRLAKGSQPWTLYVGPHGPHDPFIVPKQYVDRYDPRKIELPPSYRDQLEDKPGIYRRMRTQLWGQLSEDEVRESIAYYWAYCTMMDELFGSVLDALDRTGQAEDTLVLYLSDHGDYCGAHGLYCKGVPAFREAYHVPCVARWPKGIARPGREMNEFVSLADFSPTFLDLAGVQSPQRPTGRSLAPFFRAEQPADWRDAIFTQFNGVELYYSQRSVMTDDFKYVYNGFDYDELYDLRNDPHEMTNLAQCPEYEPAKHDLVRRMWRFAAEEEDNLIFNAYGTVALAPWGPADALGPA